MKWELGGAWWWWWAQKIRGEVGKLGRGAGWGGRVKGTGGEGVMRREERRERESERERERERGRVGE